MMMKELELQRTIILSEVSSSASRMNSRSRRTCCCVQRHKHQQVFSRCIYQSFLPQSCASTESRSFLLRSGWQFWGNIRRAGGRRSPIVFYNSTFWPAS